MNHPHRNIFLTGFMGAGKSSVGRRLAQRLGYHFADLDQLIIAREGQTISDIFASQGEAYFRDCEAAVLAEQAATTHTVFATGGGIIGRAENRAMMKKLGMVIYLRASWPTLERRLARGRGRPLADPQQGWERIRQLWESRLPWYEDADVVIDTDLLKVHDVVREIIGRLGLREAER
jgi:shikimate kinase